MFNVSAIRLFISYAGEDQPLVDHLAQDLKNAGAIVWYAPESLSLFEANWQTAIRKRIRISDCFVYVASEKAANSDNVVDEIESALRYGISIVTFWWQGDIWQDCRPNQLASRLHIDARRGRYDTALAELLYLLELTLPRTSSAAGGRRPSPSVPSAPLEAQSPFHPQRIPSPRTKLTSLGKLTDEKIDAALKEAESFQREGQIEEATVICERLIAQDVFRADVYYLVGCLHQAAGRWSEAMHGFLTSRHDARFAILSCFRLGQCAVAIGDKRSAVLHFDEAINQLHTGKLKERDADQLVQICYEAALAHRDIGEVEQAEDLFRALLHFLNAQRWEAAINLARRLMNATLRYNLPLQTEQRPIRETRPLREKLPQRSIDALEYFELPEPGRRGPINLRKPDESGVWRTPPKLPVVIRRDLKIYTLLDESDNDTRPVEIVEVHKGEPREDVLADAIAHIFGVQGSLHAHLYDLPITTRVKVSSGLREVESLIRSRLLTAAGRRCIDLIKLAPHYHDITVTLAEIYVRQGLVDQAVQRYVKLAERCLTAGDRARAIATFERLLQLDANNLSYRNRLNELLAQQVHEEQSASERGSLPLASEEEAEAGSEAEERFETPFDDESHTAGDQEIVSDESLRGEESLEANSLVNPDDLPQWIRDAPQTQDQEAINSLQYLTEHRSSGQNAPEPGQLAQLAALVQRLRANNQLDAAAEAVSKMALLAPNDPSIYAARADIALARDHIDEAVVALRTLAAMYAQQGTNADAARTYQKLAEMAWTLHQREDALSLQRLAICSADEDSSELSLAFRQRIVGYCLEAGHLSEAIEQQAIIARSYYGRKLFRPAISALVQLLVLDNTYDEGFDMLGQSYLAIGDPRLARKAYRALANLDPTSALAQRRLQEIPSPTEEEDTGDNEASSNV